MAINTTDEIKIRFNEAIKYLVGKGLINGRDDVKDISTKTGVHPNKVREAKRGVKRSLTEKFVKKFCVIYDNIISDEWILDGRGRMTYEEDYNPMTKMLPSDFDNNSENRRIISYDPTVGKPYYNVDFEMGYDFIINNQTSNPDYMINFAPYNKCDYWCNAIGDSMHPTISSGDVIAVKEIKDFSYLISGEIYAIITDNGLRTVKRIKDNGDSITLIPDNKEYPEQTIKKKNISKVFRVLGSMKMF